MIYERILYVGIYYAIYIYMYVHVGPQHAVYNVTVKRLQDNGVGIQVTFDVRCICLLYVYIIKTDAN